MVSGNKHSKVIKHRHDVSGVKVTTYHSWDLMQLPFVCAGLFTEIAWFGLA